MPEQWEYRTDTLDVAEYASRTGCRREHALIGFMDEMGLNGWEAFSVNGEDQTGYRMYFKRRFTPSPPMKTTVWKCRKENDRMCSLQPITRHPQRPENPPSTDIHEGNGIP